ncbi:mechanosensitive ion channel family protein [Aquimarina sp. MMG015]|uniref:mechanosensitive ion channel family protein n=1 Tax=Aquimarina TaxID=290174 RepID=UPI0004162A08|nr:MULTISPECIES: mechanosensitive ion channel family protein [Aquimarina]AXT56193.1 mechanosensitive ion channel family protein [Aquimarina sp. AD1]MBQ4803709.1 mechanosensitive ion channel family protein [Aquimarina sp. MMG015]RKN23218.1 mechanosensitive ion channel family protein [Aquimarina sp. AD1]
MEKLYEYFEIAIDKVVFFAPRIIGAALVFWIGFKIIKKVLQLLDKTLEKTGISDTMRPFLLSIISVVLKIAVIFAIVTILGVDLSGLLAILAAVGFAIGMSLQGSLGNFASGILIMFLKPYEAGDWIQVGDSFGKVQEIGIFSTVVITPGDKVLIIPNAKITDDVVANYSKRGVVRLEIGVTMPYNEDFSKVKRVIENAIAPIDKILDSPKTEIGIENFDSHNILIAVRPYVKPDDFWEVTFITHQEIKKAFSEHDIKVAYSEGVELGNIGV